MAKLGIACADITGAYVACSISALRPDVDLTVLYHPAEDVESFLKGSAERMEKMAMDEYLTVLPVENDGPRDYCRVINKGYSADLILDCGAKGLDTSIMFFTVMDGLFQRGFVLDILEDYMARIPEDTTSVLLALPGYSYRRDDFERIFTERQINVVDPLTEWLKHIPKGEKRGEQRFYWTKRNFELERRMEEIYQEPIRFRTYYHHPWLRGEVKR